MRIGKRKFWASALAAMLSVATASQAQAFDLPGLDSPEWWTSVNSSLFWSSLYASRDIATASTANSTEAASAPAAFQSLAGAAEPNAVLPGVTTQFAALASTGNVSNLYRFNFTGATATTGSVASVTQSNLTLAEGGTLIGLDYRVSTDTLYAFSSLNNLYTISFSGASASATLLGALTSAQGAPVSFAGGPSGFDINPLTGAITVIGGGGNQNLTITPTTTPPTGVISPQAVAYRPQNDPNFGTTPNVGGAAYTANQVGIVAAPQLFAIDYNLDILVQVTGSSLRTIGSLGQNFGANVGFDIVTVDSIDYTFATSGSDLYTIDLSTGAASLLAGNFTGNGAQLIGLTALPEPTTGGLAGFAALGLLSRFRRRVKVG